MLFSWRLNLLFIAMFFLVFAIFIMIRVFRGYQAIWLGLILLTFGFCIIGLVGLVPRFSNYSLSGLLNLSLEQPSWAWNLLSSLPLNDFIRFRLWSAVGFIVAIIGFTFTYTGERFQWKNLLVASVVVVFLVFFLWRYDPEELYKLYKNGANLIHYPQVLHSWESSLKMLDGIMFYLIGMLLGYSLYKIFRLLFKTTIMQKKVQVLWVGIGNMVLCVFFMVLFCTGRSSILNAHTVATTLLPLGRDYPFYDMTYLRAVPFGALIVIVAVMLSIMRYGFLGSWRIHSKHLEQQIHTANKAVKIALHSFKNQFLGVQMAMDMAASSLSNIKDESVERAFAQIDWAKEACAKALVRLDVLQTQAERVRLNPHWLNERELWTEAKKRCLQRLNGVNLIERLSNERMTVWGDREHLIAVLENLLQNALDAMIEKKEADYKPEIIVEIGKEYEWSYFRITDNGPGIDKENQHRIFQPFFTTKPAKSNWGLGLTYCHRVIKLHRGFINLRSRPGLGATFEVVLRCRENLNRMT